MTLRSTESAEPWWLLEFCQDLEECLDLYQTAAEEYVSTTPPDGESPASFVKRMVELHRGLLVKLVLEMAQADWTWSPEELALARELVRHCWGKTLPDTEVQRALPLLESAAHLPLGTLLAPFVWCPPFRSRVDRLKTVLTRVANLVAKADGRVRQSEVRRLELWRSQLSEHLDQIPLSGYAQTERAQPHSPPAISKQNVPLPARQPASPQLAPAQPASPVADPLPALFAELNRLIGLAEVKGDVQGLVNYLKLQQARSEFGLPQTQRTLHAVFRGNPGTGKTTIARLLGRMYGALGVLSRGHLVETDRAGLVAEYAGQTAPKAHRKIDEALDGVLFIDEAYALVAEGDDPFGQEALQTLLKRMEDDRQRLIVILAGYPEPLDRLLRSNPGLSSRFGRSFTFADYSVLELCQILQGLCDAHRYVLPAATRVRVWLGFAASVAQRDEHFGNARLVRNLFERAIARLANRIAAVAPLTLELLTTLEPDDIEFVDLDPQAWQAALARKYQVRLECSGCRVASRMPAEWLGRQVRCPQCGVHFTAEWGELTPVETSA